MTEKYLIDIAAKLIKELFPDRTEEIINSLININDAIKDMCTFSDTDENRIYALGELFAYLAIEKIKEE